MKLSRRIPTVSEEALAFREEAAALREDLASTRQVIREAMVELTAFSEVLRETRNL